MAQVLLPETPGGLLEAMARADGYCLMAGGTDVLVKRREGKLNPACLIGLERIAALRGIALDGGEAVIGAAATLGEIAAHPLVVAHLDVLRQAIAVLGAPPIRHMATLGGNICTASPAGDTLAPLHVLDARVELMSVRGTRQVPVAEFIAGPGRTALAPGEVLTRVRIPLPAAGGRAAYFKVGCRKAQAIAVVSLAACWWEEADRTVREIRLAWGSVAPRILRIPEVEDALRGRRLTVPLLRAAGAVASRAVSPIGDVRATADYRRQVAGNLLLYFSAMRSESK